MRLTQTYFYSPFCPNSLKKRQNKVLLLLLILNELVRNPQGLEKTESLTLLTPFDWSCKPTPIVKVQEHLSLLEFAFPHLKKNISQLKKNIHKPISEIFYLIHPFIFEYRDNENLLLFLFKHQNILDVKPLLDKICPEGMETLKERIASSFRKRGYTFTRWKH
jgi:hypothetical protein